MDAVNELIRKSGFSTNVVATQFILTSETDTASVDTEISNPAAQLTGAEKAVIVHKATGGDHT